MEIGLLVDFEVTRVQGGMIEFAETEIYPDYLHFNSGYYQHEWKEKCISNNQAGSLELDGRTVFEYQLSETGCKIRAVMDDSTFSAWCDMPVSLMMKD